MGRLELAVECGEEFRISHFYVRDELSTPFEIWLQVLSNNADLDPRDIIDARTAFLIDNGGDGSAGIGPQVWTGICTQFRLLEVTDQGLCCYLLRIEPELARLRYRRQCRSFVEMSYRKICEQVLNTPWSMMPAVVVQASTAAFSSDTPAFTLQYHESDLAFLSRLLETSAVSYRFDADGLADAWPVTEGMKLVLTDKPKRLAQRAPIKVHDPSMGLNLGNYVAKLQVDHNLRTHDMTVVDYSFRRPATQLEENHVSAHSATRKTSRNYTQRAFAIGALSDTRLPSPANLSGAAKRSANASSSDAREVRFETNAFDLVPGTAFTIENHSALDDSEVLMVTSLTLEGEANERWHGSVTAVFASDPYAPPQLSPKPSIYGVQSAKVAKVDELGRIAVIFPWDEPQNALAWLRMSHPYASKAHGMHALPLVDDEVLVSFLQGDPDQPLVVGSLYNETHPPPHDPKKHPTRSTWRDQSNNELTLESKSSSEVLHLAASKDMNVAVENNQLNWIGANHEQTVTGDDKRKVDGSASLTVGADLNQAAGGKVSLKAAEQHIKLAEGYGLDAGTNVHLKAGLNAVIEAGVTLTLKAGSNFVEISPSGVTIKGTMVMINCPGGPPGDGAGASPTAPVAPGPKPELPS